MIGFLFKGLLRDRHRSLFPILVVTLGVALTVLLHCWITGIMGDFVDFNARFSTGHVKIVTRAYADHAEQLPNDLALMDVAGLIAGLEQEYPEMIWVPRIRFGGLLDVPDEQGETRDQGPAMGLAVDLLSDHPTEPARLNIHEALVRGRLPERAGEILVSDEFAGKLGVAPGEKVTLLGSTMYGSMAMQNFSVAGTVKFGVGVMDRGAFVTDVTDAQNALDMDDAASEILGFFSNGIYHDDRAQAVAERFNARFAESDDEYAPVMLPLRAQNDLATMLDYVSAIIAIFIAVFVFAMSIVLWNAGLISGLRRYGEVGVRLAIGEEKGHVYRSLIYESVIVGFAGSALGTAIGLGFGYLLQTKGIDVGHLMKNATMMLPNVYRAQVTATTWVIGFLPGLFSTLLGTMLSGIGIYRRKTAQLFKELET